MHEKNRIEGLTLIEMLVSMLMSLLILQTLMSSVIQLHKQQDWVHSILVMQGTTRLLASEFQHHVAVAGFSGCLPRRAGSVIIDHQEHADADRIQFETAAIDYASLTEPMQEGAALIVSADISVKRGQQYVITDCHSVEWFTVQNIIRLDSGKTVLIPDTPLQTKFPKNAEVHRWLVEQWSVATTGRRDKAGLPIKALFVRNDENSFGAWIEGVEELRASYLWNHAGMNYFVSGVHVSVKLRDEKMHITRELDAAMR